MRVDNRIEYLAQRRLVSHLPVVIKWPLRYLRAARKEWTIAKGNEEVLHRLRRNGGTIKLEMGSGAKKGTNGWTTVDIQPRCDLQLDLLKRTPFLDEEVAEIYSSHALEYFCYHDIISILREWRRILRCEGWLLLALPNARIFLEAYISDRTFDAAYYCRYKPALYSHAKIDYVNYMAYMDAHRYMFDEENLIPMLKVAGFNNAYLRSFDPAIDMKERQFESLYSAAIK